MPILYALIAKKQNIILCDYTSHTGNFQMVTMQLLQTQVQPDSARSLELDDFHFHYINEDGLNIMAMCDKTTDKKLAFMFIQDVRKTFLDTYTPREIDLAKGYSLKSFGSQFIKPKMEMYNENPTIANDDKAEKLLSDMKYLKDNMVENIEALIQRDGKIEIMAETAMQLSTVSNSYKTRSRKLKENERRKRWMLCIIGTVVLIIILAIIAWLVFGNSENKDHSNGIALPAANQEEMAYFLK